MRISLSSPAALLSRVDTDLTQLWLIDPHVRRFLRRCGEEEAVVTGRAGSYPLFSAYLTHAAKDRREAARVREALSAMNLSSPATDPAALWREGCERLLTGALCARDLLAPLFPITCLLPPDQMPQCDSRTPEIVDFTPLLDLKNAKKMPFLSEKMPFSAALSAIKARLSTLFSVGCTGGFLTVERALPRPMRMKEEDADAAYGRLWEGKTVDAATEEGLRARLLFALFSVLARENQPLLLRAGAKEWGDGRIALDFDALSFCALAEKCGEQMPRVLLLPRSQASAQAMKSLTGIFPSKNCFSAISLLPRSAVCEASSPAAMRIAWRKSKEK